MSDEKTTQQSRRTFFKTAGGGILLSSLAASIVQKTSAQQQDDLKKNEKLPPEKRVGWAIVGLGDFGTKQIIPNFADCQRSRLVALVSGDRAKADRYAAQYGVKNQNIYNYQNFDRIRDNPEIDVVYIILPNGMHHEYTIRGFQAGKNVMCEKPMANTVKECEEMIATGRKANKKLMIAYRAQYEPFNLAAIEKCRNGELGRLKTIVADHGRNLNPQEKRDQWRMNKKLAGGGSLYDIGIYSLNAARYLAGEEPIEISAQVFSTPDDPRFKEVEENVNFTLKFPSGVLANCTSSYGYQEVKRYRAFGDKAWLELDPATDYYKHRMLVGRKNEQASEENKTAPKFLIEEQEIQEGNQFAAEIDHLSECIQENKQPKTPGEEGLQDVRLMQLIYQAAREGRTIKVPAANVRAATK
jgi:predicted dehydrogenase